MIHFLFTYDMFVTKTRNSGNRCNSANNCRKPQKAHSKTESQPTSTEKRCKNRIHDVFSLNVSILLQPIDKGAKYKFSGGRVAPERKDLSTQGVLPRPKSICPLYFVFAKVVFQPTVDK